MMEKLTEQTIIQELLKGKKIYIREENSINAVLYEPYFTLIRKGFANYSNEIISKNWKTEYWRAPPSVRYIPPEPINNRFEILDL